jgi:hypothetical protein
VNVRFGFAICLAAALLWGVLTLWAPQRWPLAVFQCFLLLLLPGWGLLEFRRSGSVALHPVLAAIALVPLSLGVTIYAWETGNAIINWTTHCAAAFLAYQVAAHSRVRRWLLSVLLWFAVLVSIQATLQVFTSAGKVFWLFDSGYQDEVLGPFVYRNNYAQFIELFLPLAVWRSITDRRRTLLWIVVAAVMFASVVAGVSRAGFAILVFEVLAVIAIASARGRLSGAWGLGVAAQCAAAIGIWGFVVGWSHLIARLFGEDPLSDLRWPLIGSTIEMIRANPVAGVGLGNWSLAYPAFATFDSGAIANQAHCDWLQWFAEGGLPLLAVMLFIFSRLVVPALETGWGIGVLAVFLHALVDYPFQQRPAFATLVFCVAMVLLAESRAAHNQLDTQRNNGSD